MADPMLNAKTGPWTPAKPRKAGPVESAASIKGLVLIRTDDLRG
jgi:hypothetical protein